MREFQIRAGGRLFLITPEAVSPCTVDVRDMATGTEAQSIVAPGDLASRATLLADSQTRDAIASAYYNATAREGGRYPVGGTALPADFTVEGV
jgi:hypothetical protein